MRLCDGIAPAMAWRALLFCTMLAAGVRGAAPVSSPPELAQVGKPGEAEAARILEQFRRAGIAGDFYLEFNFVTLPRRSEGRTFQGRLWGGRRSDGTMFRIEIEDGASATQRLLICNGERPGVWRWNDGSVVKLDAAASLAPLVAGIEVSAFDLQMPYLYWPGATLERIARVFGRPAYAYLFRAPPALLNEQHDVAAARAYLDTQFNALMQTELLDSAGKTVKSFALISLKKVGDQHIPKQADYRNERTRDKTRFQVTSAALNLHWEASVFAPEGLRAAGERPAETQLVRIEP